MTQATTEAWAQVPAANTTMQSQNSAQPSDTNAQSGNIAATGQNQADMATDTNNNDPATDNTALIGGQRPVPKRLSAQERWNRLSPEERANIINEWSRLDETIRPVFPIYRDNALEQQAQGNLQGNLQGNQQGPVMTQPINQPATTAGKAPENTPAAR